MGEVWTELLAACILTYCLGVLSWFVLHRVFGDRWWWLFILNTFALYLFLPFPFVIIGGVFLARSSIWIAISALCIIVLFLYGRSLLLHTACTGDATRMLRMMTYNLLIFNTHSAAICAALQASKADIIALQELNATVAHAIHHDLHEDYPYQLLQTHPHQTGMGIISKYPLQPTGETLNGRWIGTPQIATIDVHGTTIMVVNLHNVSFPKGNQGWPTTIEWSSRERERQAQQIVDFATTHPGALVVMGDCNMGPMSTAYRIVTQQLHDAWHECGHGLGHTFPGGHHQRGSRPKLFGRAVPPWLIRIDYIFHSAGLRACSAHIGPWDGHSDHRPVVAELVVDQ